MNKKLTTSIVACSLLATNLLSNEKLESIVITSATKSEQSIKDVTSNVEVITKEELEEKNFINVADALNTINGFDVTANGGLGQTVALRLNGMHYTNTLVLIDGIRYNDITNGSAFLQHILISDIKQIEVIKGAQSGIWGADAAGGVVNIITNEAKEGFHGNVNAQFGSFKTRKLGAGLSYKNKDFYAKLAFQNVTSDGYSAQVPNIKDLDKYEDDKYENTTIDIKTGFNLNDNNKIDFTHKTIDSKFDYDNDVTDSSYVKDPIASANNDAKQESKSKFSKINFNHINDFITIDIYGSKSDFNRKDPAGFTKEFDGEIEEIGIKTNLKYNKNDFFIIGFDNKKFIQEKGYKFDYTNKGTYLSNSNSFNNNTTIFTQSLRYDKYSTFKNKFTGKIGLKQIINDFEFNTNYGTGYKAPSLYQLSRNNVNELKAELTKSFDASLKFKGFKVGYFNNKIDDLLDYVSTNGGSYENTSGTSTIKGYEASYKTNLGQDTFISVNYTYQDAKDKDNKTLGRVAKELIKVSADYYGVKNLHVNVNANYVGDRWDRNGEPVNGDKTGKYTVWNTVVNYDINKNVKTYVKIDNIFDKKYETVKGYSTAPRSAYLGVNYKF